LLSGHLGHCHTMTMLNKLPIKTSELRYRRLFEAAQDGILILDAERGAITDVNPFLIMLLGYSREEFVSKKLWEVGAFKDIEASQIAFEALQKNEYIRYEDLPLKAKDGRLVQVEFVSNVYLEGNEKVIQCNIRDITERKQAEDALIRSEANLREQSVRDPLTNLYNRRYMEETLERELLRCSRKQLPLSILMLDIDYFKRFNDTYGHLAGDEILCEVGMLLLEHVRREDVPCRYGGDEFVVVLPDAPPDVARTRAELVRDYVQYIHIQNNELELVSVTISLGVANFPTNGRTRTEILRAADEALYRAKQEGRNRVVVAP
jgi:diguanylate cyclase (GGDEF)-like protein/PAS domain S-box-containing protein